MTEQEKIQALEGALRNCIITLKDIENLPARWSILRNLPGWMSVEAMVVTTYRMSEQTLQAIEEAGE